jgi:hypothetical protein
MVGDKITLSPMGITSVDVVFRRQLATESKVRELHAVTASHQAVSCRHISVQKVSLVEIDDCGSKLAGEEELDAQVDAIPFTLEVVAQLTESRKFHHHPNGIIPLIADADAANYVRMPEPGHRV